MKMKWMKFANNLIRKSEIKNVTLDKRCVIMYAGIYDYIEVYNTKKAASKRLDEVLRILNRS